jgi:hypothetical protein
LRIKTVLPLVVAIVGACFDLFTAYAIIKNPEFTGWLIISWGLPDIGLTLLGLTWYLTGQLNEASNVSQ